MDPEKQRLLDEMRALAMESEAQTKKEKELLKSPQPTQGSSLRGSGTPGGNGQSPGRSDADRLKQLRQLYEQGMVTEQEFQERSAMLLKRLSEAGKSPKRESIVAGPASPISTRRAVAAVPDGQFSPSPARDQPDVANRFKVKCAGCGDVKEQSAMVAHHGQQFCKICHRLELVKGVDTVSLSASAPDVQRTEDNPYVAKAKEAALAPTIKAQEENAKKWRPEEVRTAQRLEKIKRQEEEIRAAKAAKEKAGK